MSTDVLPRARAFTNCEALLAVFTSIVKVGRTSAALTTIAKAAAAVTGMEMAAIVANGNDRFEFVARERISFATMHFEWDSDRAGYGFDTTFGFADLRLHPYLGRHPLTMGSPFLRSMLHVPIKLAGAPFALSLFAFSTRARNEGPEFQQRLVELSKLASLCEAHLSLAAEFIVAAGKDWQCVNLDAACKTIQAMARPAALLDSKMQIQAVNNAMTHLLGFEARPHHGARIDGLEFVGAKKLRLLARKSIESFSDPNVAMTSVSETAVEDRLIYFQAFPLVIAFDHAPLYALFAESLDLAAGASHSAFQVSGEAKGQGFEAIETFLFSTLIEKAVVRRRGKTQYSTVRAWRKPVKKYQMEAMRSLKALAPETFLRKVAEEIVVATQLLLGGSKFDFVVPVPSSHGQEGHGFSELLAREVADASGVPYREVLTITRSHGASHPKKNVGRPPMLCDVDLTGKFALIVDDIATSGRHIEEATMAIRATAKGSFAIAWIGPDVSRAKDD